MKNIRLFNLIGLLLLGMSQVALASKTSFTNEMPTTGNLVLGVYESGELGQHATSINAQLNGYISHAIEVTGFEGKSQKTQLITAPADSELEQILLIGLGSKTADRTERDWQEIGGEAAQKAVKAFEKLPLMVIDTDSPESSAQVAFGANLGSYYFDKYYTDEDRLKSQNHINIFTQDAQASESFYTKELAPLATATVMALDIANEPANVIYPQSFVDQWTQHFKGMKNVKVRVYDEKDMLKQGMGAIYGVGQGSDRPPRMMVVEYMAGDPDAAPIVVVGKGITFDTGGISLKNPQNMWNMKFDMSGAANTMGVIHALAGREAKVNLVGIAALAENMPSAKAQRPGDVVKSMSGKTIQIRSTDAEGRLVLADAIHYGDIKYNPALLVDLATLTGSVVRALGNDYAGMFTRHEELAAPFIAAGKASGEEMWRMPLNDNHFKAIENKVADVMNSGPDAPGASAGAAFIGAFVRETTPWVHFDVAGVAWGDKAQPLNGSPGARSYGIRLLNNYIKTHFENKP